MTIQETFHTATAGGRSRPLARLAAALGAAVKRLQCARMVTALGQLSDSQLAEIGIARSEIAAHAHRLVHGDR